MAAPFVSGAAALLMSCLNASLLEIKERIVSSVDVYDNLSAKTISSGRLNIYNALNDPLKPIRPTGLSAALNNNTVLLQWMDNSNIETGYIIERRTDNSDWVVVAYLGSNTTSYTDTNLAHSKTYYYRVKAAHNDQTSLASNEVTVAVPNNLNPSSSSGGGGCSMTESSAIDLLCWLIIPASILFRKISKKSL